MLTPRGISERLSRLGGALIGEGSSAKESRFGADFAQEGTAFTGPRSYARLTTALRPEGDPNAERRAGRGSSCMDGGFLALVKNSTSVSGMWEIERGRELPARLEHKERRNRSPY